MQTSMLFIQLLIVSSNCFQFFCNKERDNVLSLLASSSLPITTLPSHIKLHFLDYSMHCVVWKWKRDEASFTMPDIIQAMKQSNAWYKQSENLKPTEYYYPFLETIENHTLRFKSDASKWERLQQFRLERDAQIPQTIYIISWDKSLQ